MSIRLGIIGGGVMAEAIITRLLAANIYPANTVLVSEPQPQRRGFLSQTYAVQVTTNNQETLEASEALLLAIKPQVLDKVTAPLKLENKPDSPLILSILAGVTLARLEAAFPGFPVLRVMPNTPATVGAGMTAIAPGKNIDPSHLSLATAIFSAVGEVVEVPESMMDGVTGLSGSGPAFVALMIEALADGGVAAGLPRAIAAKLALQTVLGTAKLIHETGLHPAQLKDNVTSPGGTTIAGVGKLEEKGFRSALIEAVKAAYLRSQELGK
ncbi:pyrroline-5-carboxylate reductase [Crocosphaera sp. UHCC 0190]|uniref:pyrroline-5-carboxylate reductase n=1 Tax=Crocosphaera sp. UHCC 0190 TaxID=3110246 RepID=UPI002B1EDAC8|nr:pyrroline-5-carboxylate reductase [Crocosphaera sp. UHCC 0190]MEA5511057.1 pyrroline-5-carboxylate reductase [Crocosphaera sp. UHCC 0190]